MNDSKWFQVSRPKKEKDYRLFCFPYAGGSAAVYSTWNDFLPDNVELVAIQPPGRANRWSEKLHASVTEMVDDLVHAIPAWLDRPYMIYGHSLGSSVAFEMLHALEQKKLRLPERFFAGARRAPHYPPRTAPIHEYPLEEFKSEIKKLNGTPDSILNDPDMMEILVPVLRKDFKAAYTYHRDPFSKIDCKVSIFGGAADNTVAQEDLLGWQEHFATTMDMYIVDGDHFFLDDNTKVIVDRICDGI